MTSAASLGLAGLTVAAIATTAPDDLITTRLAGLGLAAFAVALIAGSSRLVGLSSIPVVGSAIVATAVASDPGWARTLLVGCAWFVTVELAWHAIDAREHGPVGGAVARRRVHEVATVVTGTLVVGLIGAIATDWAPPRTLYAQAPIVVTLFAALGVVTFQLTRADQRRG